MAMSSKSAYLSMSLKLLGRTGMKLQKKLPISILSSYHQWIFENHKSESVEVL